MFFNFNFRPKMPTEDEAIVGRSHPIKTSAFHYVNRKSMFEPYPEGTERAMFGGGCFWGVEKRFWLLNGVYVTAAGYSAGYTKNPTYREVCSGQTGHNEVVLVVFYPEQIPYQELLATFWECHDPTQGMRQGNDVGTQYRSGIYTYNSKQRQLAQESYQSYQESLRRNGYGRLTTEIRKAAEFYFAEDYHQQYLARNPGGYCGLGGTGVCYVSKAGQPST